MPSIETVVQDGDIKHGTAHAGSSCVLPNWIVDGIPAVKLHEESFHMQISMPLAAQNVFTPDVEAKSCEGWDCEGGRRLVPDLSGGDDPDDCFSRIPYEKGFYFLFYLQARPPPLIPRPHRRHPATATPACTVITVFGDDDLLASVESAV